MYDVYEKVKLEEIWGDIEEIFKIGKRTIKKHRKSRKSNDIIEKHENLRICGRERIMLTSQKH